MSVFNRNFVLCLCVLALIAGSGCASNVPRLQRVSATEKERVMNGRSIYPGINLHEQLPEEDIFGLTDQMKQFVDQTVSGQTTTDYRVRTLLDAVISSAQHGIKFDEKATFTAREVFRHRRANCLSFTTMMVPMLRYLGIKVEFNQVDIPPVWDLQNNSMLVLYQHVNAIFTKADKRQEVLDINMEEYELRYPQHIIDDRTVEALFYNNRGMEFLLAGDELKAFLYLRKAIDIDPGLPFLWTNLGTLYRQEGKFRDAEITYRIALEIDPVNLVAMSKAERNYRDLGDFTLAEQYRKRAERFRQNNPYYRYSLARDEVLAGNYKAALEDINAAIDRYKMEHRFYFLQGLIFSALAEKKQADASFKKALELAPSEKQQERYRSKLEKINLG